MLGPEPWETNERLLVAQHYGNLITGKSALFK